MPNWSSIAQIWPYWHGSLYQVITAKILEILSVSIPPASKWDSLGLHIFDLFDGSKVKCLLASTSLESGRFRLEFSNSEIVFQYAKCSNFWGSSFEHRLKLSVFRAASGPWRIPKQTNWATLLNSNPLRSVNILDCIPFSIPFPNLNVLKMAFKRLGQQNDSAR